MTLKSRFADPAALIDALCAQKIVQGRELAQAIAEHGELVEFAPGGVLIEQGGSDQDIYFLLAGRCQVIVHGTRLYVREPGVTVGEMSAVNPSISRTSTIEALEPTVAWKIGHTRLAEIGRLFPDVWRLLAADLVGRIEQRNRYVSKANTRARVFMICSAEALAIARAIRIGLQYTADVVLWSDEDIFSPGGYPLEALEEQVNVADFGIALAEPDDLVRSRDKQSAAPRDNVIFELGFFMSRLGRRRALLLVPRSEDIKLPSDFKGLTPIAYKRASADLPVALGPTIDQINNLIVNLGVRSSLREAK